MQHTIHPIGPKKIQQQIGQHLFFKGNKFLTYKQQNVQRRTANSKSSIDLSFHL